MNIIKLSGLALAVGTLGLPAAHATVTLNYTGNNFISFPPTPPYTTSDHVTASLTLANPLPDNLNINAPSQTPLAFMLNDGVQTIEGPAGGVGYNFQFETNSSGSIIDWVVSASLGPNDYIFSELITPPLLDTVLSEDLGVSNGGEAVESTFSSPSDWTDANTDNSVPAPPPSNLAAVVLLGLWFGWRRRRQIFSGWRASP